MENSISIYNRKRVPVPGTVIKQFHTQRFFILTVSHYSAVVYSSRTRFWKLSNDVQGSRANDNHHKKMQPNSGDFLLGCFFNFLLYLFLLLKLMYILEGVLERNNL